MVHIETEVLEALIDTQVNDQVKLGFNQGFQLDQDQLAQA
jgi:hypothetical protein